MLTDQRRFNEMFDYLRGDTLDSRIAPHPERGALVFGRADTLVAHKAGALASNGIVNWAVISGGVGKDSGDLKTSEAEFLRSALLDPTHDYDIDSAHVYKEEKATNGGENARFGLAMIKDKRLALPNGQLVTVAHATSARRLSETVRFEGGKSGSEATDIISVATDYAFDARAQYDRHEAASEFLRLADWPAKGWLLPQVELPEHLVELARATVDKTPAQPSALTGSVLRAMPHGLRIALLRKLGGGSNIPGK